MKHISLNVADEIKKIADEGPCVIVGRCADYILRDREDCLNVFIHGEQAEKIERVMRLYEKSKEGAIKMMKDMDKKRSINYNYYTDREWGMVKNYAVTLNSSILGYDKCVDAIIELAE